MATATILPSTFPPHTKRKLDAAPTDAASKRARVGTNSSQIPSRLPLEPHDSILAELRPKYDVATLSVISSTSINKRIDQILAHLGRFHPVDLAVLPGVVLMHARSRDAAKMVSVIEMARRRIQECGQKWYQYNRLYEVKVEEPEGNTMIEETVLGNRGAEFEEDRDGGGGEAEAEAEDDCFETAPTVFERAVMGRPKTEHELYMSIFLSRVPVPELRDKSFITAQSNSGLVDQARKQQFG